MALRTESPPRKLLQIAQDYEFVVLFTSTVGFYSDLAHGASHEGKKARNQDLLSSDRKCKSSRRKACWRARTLILWCAVNSTIAVVDYAHGKPLSEIANASYIKDGKVVHNPPRPMLQTDELDALPFATEVYEKQPHD